MNIKKFNEIQKIFVEINKEISQLKYVVTNYCKYNYNDLEIKCVDDLDEEEVIMYKINKVKYAHKYVLVDKCIKKIKAVYNTNNKYTIFKIENMRFKESTVEHLKYKLVCFGEDLHNICKFNSVVEEIDMLYNKINLFISEFYVKDNVLEIELKKIEKLLHLCEELKQLTYPQSELTNKKIGEVEYIYNLEYF